MTNYELLIENIKSYKKKYYLNLLIKNSLFAVFSFLCYAIVINGLEYFLNFSTFARSIIFYCSLYFVGAIFLFWILKPVFHLISNKYKIKDEDVARQVSQLFPEIDDKVLNTLQLQKNNSDNVLIAASVEQKSQDILAFDLSVGIDYKKNAQYLQILLIPIIFIAVIVILYPAFFTESTTRIINYETTFRPLNDIDYVVINEGFEIYRGEDFEFEIKMTGDVIGNNVHLYFDGRKTKMVKRNNNEWHYTFRSVQKNKDFSIYLSDNQSDKYTIHVINKPSIYSSIINLKFPKYTNLSNKSLENIGNLIVPKGTVANWKILTKNTKGLNVHFSTDSVSHPSEKNKNGFFFNRYLNENQNYSLLLISPDNAHDSIEYSIKIIEDQYPKIGIVSLADTLFYQNVLIQGEIEDDYGFDRLEFVTLAQNNKEKIEKVGIINSETSQSFLYHWHTDSLVSHDKTDIKYFFRIWDNDAINGSKYTESQHYKLDIPSKTELAKIVEKKAESSTEKIEESIEKSKSLNDKLEKLDQKLKQNKNRNWKIENSISDLIQTKKDIEKEIEQLQSLNKEINKERNQISKDNQKLQEKSEQLQKLMDELLDEETKKLYAELKKLLEENKNNDELSDKLEEIKNKEVNFEQELERSLELFKRLQFDLKLEKTINDLEQLKNKQKKLSQKANKKSEEPNKEKQKNKANEKSTDKLKQEEKNKSAENSSDNKKAEKNQTGLEQQNQLNKEFEKTKKSIDDLKKLNQDLKKKNKLDDYSTDIEKIEKEMQKSSDELEKGNKSESSKAQNKASEEMQQLKEKLQNAQSDMAMEILMENLNNLRHIIDNLVKLSFEQEDIFKQLKTTSLSDPNYINISQRQLNISEDVQIIKDSLIALSQRIIQIESFITRELNNMDNYMTSSLLAMKERKINRATTSQQYTMTSINNLALLLDDVLKQLQQQMAQSQSMPQKGKPQEAKPNLSQLQKSINQQIEKIKQGQKSGRQLSKELATLAAQQESLRRKLEGLQKQQSTGNQLGKDINDAIKNMKKSEMDIVRKNITQETIQRQQNILDQLLKSERAIQKKELDNERKSKTAEDLKQEIPKKLEEYIKNNQKKIDLLNTIPPTMNRYYKEESKKYFQQLNTN